MAEQQAGTGADCMMAKPEEQHRWLRKFVGDWTNEAECSMGPGQPTMKMLGTERVRMIGDLWIVGDGTGQTPDGSAATMILTLGYDPAKQRFVGTWIGSMMTHLWHYDGQLDASKKVLTLESEGPSFAGDGTMARYRDIHEWVSDDHRVLTSCMPGDGGTWTTFMTAHYRRT